MNCDICGRTIPGQAFRVKVEGAKLLVCSNCQSLGKPYTEDPLQRQSVGRLPPPRMIPKPLRKAPELPRGMEEVDIVDDYAERVRRYREKLGLTQEDLAMRVKQKLSVIQKIETGKMIPDLRLCRELEHELKTRLLAPREAEEAKIPKAGKREEVTLGDIVHVKGNSKADFPS